MVAAGPKGAVLSTGRPLATTRGVHWHGFPRTHSWSGSGLELPEVCGPVLRRLKRLGRLEDELF